MPLPAVAQAVDPVWNTDDKERARTLDARLAHLRVPDDKRAALIPCMVWKAKFPGLRYSADIEQSIAGLSCI
jgi:hypothetical protein